MSELEKAALPYGGNPMMRMQDEEIVGRAYNLLLNIRNGHMTATAVAGLDMAQRNTLFTIEQRNLAKVDNGQERWVITPAGLTELSKLQTRMEELRMATGSQYGSVDVPKAEQATEPGVAIQHFLHLRFSSKLRMRLKEKTSWGRNELLHIIDLLEAEALVDMENKYAKQ